jgi:hypothetical protein
MKYVLACILLLVCGYGRAQQKDPVQFAASITAEDLKKNLYTIASDEMEGRETATNGQKKAAAYIEDIFRANGLKAIWNGSYQQRFPVYQDSLERASLSINGHEFRRDTDFAVSFNSGYNITLDAGEVLFAGFGRSESTRDDYKNINARGKIVLVIPCALPDKVKGKKIPGRVPDFFTLQEAAGKNGVTALLIVDSRFPRMPMPAKGNMYIEDYKKENIPNTFFISDSVAMKIMGNDYAAVKKIIKTELPAPKSYVVNANFDLAKSTDHLESSNVIGMLEGADKKDEALIITAHYDHLGKRDSIVYFGADDDGSGTVTILQLVKAFSKAAAEGAKLRRNIIFMTVSGEEKGLWGSDYYSEYPAFPLEKTTSDINIDMIGRVESGRKADSLNYVYVVGDNRLSSDLRPISEEVNKKTLNLNLDYKFNAPDDPERIFYRSDHYNFAKNGVPAVFYFNGLHNDYHRPSDTPDKINYELLAKRAQLIFYTAWEIANRDEMLKRDLE